VSHGASISRDRKESLEAAEIIVPVSPDRKESLELPEVASPVAELPEVASPVAELPEVASPVAEFPVVASPVVELPEVASPVPEVASPVAEVPVESPLEKSVGLLASDLIGEVLQASTEEMTASAIVADVGLNAVNELAAADVVDAATLEAVQDVGAIESSGDLESSQKQKKTESGLEDSFEVLQSTPEKKNSVTTEIKLPLDEMESWLTSSADDVGESLIVVKSSDGVKADTKVVDAYMDEIEAEVEADVATGDLGTVADGGDLLDLLDIETKASVKADVIEAEDNDDVDDEDDDDEFAKIMATARKMDAKAKERGDSDPSPAIGLNLGGGGSDDFLEKLAKKISKPSESEDAMTSDLAALTGGAAAAAAAASLNDTMGSESSSAFSSDKSLDTTNNSFFSARSDVTLVEEPSLLDFDEEAFQEELKGALSSTSPTVMPLESEVEPLTPVTTLPDPFTAFDITASKEAQDIATPVAVQNEDAATANAGVDSQDSQEDGAGDAAAGGKGKKRNRRKKKKGPVSNQ